MTNIATFLYEDFQKPSTHLFTTNIACSSNHSVPDTVQRGVLFSLPVNLTFYGGTPGSVWGSDQVNKGAMSLIFLLLDLYWPATLWCIWMHVLEHYLA